MIKNGAKRGANRNVSYHTEKVKISSVTSSIKVGNKNVSLNHNGRFKDRELIFERDLEKDVLYLPERERERVDKVFDKATLEVIRTPSRSLIMDTHSHLNKALDLESGEWVANDHNAHALKNHISDYKDKYERERFGASLEEIKSVAKEVAIGKGFKYLEKDIERANTEKEIYQTMRSSKLHLRYNDEMRERGITPTARASQKSFYDFQTVSGKTRNIGNEHILTLSRDLMKELGVEYRYDNELSYIHKVNNISKFEETMKGMVDVFSKHAGVEIISVNLHMDESTPHIHIITSSISTREERGVERTRSRDGETPFGDREKFKEWRKGLDKEICNFIEKTRGIEMERNIDWSRVGEKKPEKHRKEVIKEAYVEMEKLMSPEKEFDKGVVERVEELILEIDKRDESIFMSKEIELTPEMKRFVEIEELLKPESEITPQHEITPQQRYELINERQEVLAKIWEIHSHASDFFDLLPDIIKGRNRYKKLAKVIENIKKSKGKEIQKEKEIER